jgi:ubiquinone/menaquinone biosynthesis C-methylase UbiE
VKQRKDASYRAIAAYYDAEYESNHLLDHDTPFMLSHMPKRAARVLELCCGTARAAIPVAEAGHRVVGVDYDAALLAIARRKRDMSGISESRLSLVRQNVLKLKLDERFDWAFLLFNTLLNFTTLADQDRLVSRVAAHLKPGGRFWVDLFHPDLSILAEAHHAHYDSATFYVHELDRSVHRTTEIRRSDTRSQVQQLTFHYAWADAGGDVHHEKIEFELTWMFPRELVLLLERHGFVVEALYGDYDASPITPDSPRIIALAKKR